MPAMLKFADVFGALALPNVTVPGPENLLHAAVASVA